MANAGLNNTVSKSTVDDLFQTVVGWNVPHLIAKKHITNALSIGKVLMDRHITGNACKTDPREHWVNLDEPEQAPPEGLTHPVHPQAWDAGGIFTLVILDWHLFINPRFQFDFPWKDHSFSVSNWDAAIEYLRSVIAPPKSEPMAVRIEGPIEVFDRRKRKPKKPATPVGAPPRYDNEAIRKIAEDVITRGIPDTQELFFEKVRDECGTRSPRVHCHKSTTRFREVVLPIYNGAIKAAESEKHSR
jgi:hypothetical protein